MEIIYFYTIVVAWLYVFGAVGIIVMQSVFTNVSPINVFLDWDFRDILGLIFWPITVPVFLILIVWDSTR